METTPIDTSRDGNLEATIRRNSGEKGAPDEEPRRIPILTGQKCTPLAQGC